MEISTIPPCRSQWRWVCTNRQGLDYCNQVMGKSMPPHLRHDSGDEILHCYNYTHQLEPNLISATIPTIQPRSLKYISSARSPKAPSTASSLLPALCVQCYVIIFIHTTFSKIKTTPSICMIHQKWTKELNVILHFFTKQSELCCLMQLGYLCREKPAM